MPAYLGPASSLVRVPGVSGLQISPDLPSTTYVSMDNRATQYRAPRARRTWQVVMGVVEPRQLATLDELLDPQAQGSPPPWWWISDYAAATNMLLPRVTAFWPGEWDAGAAIRGNAVDTVDGLAIASLIPSGGASTVFGQSPAIPAVPHTFSVYARSLNPATRVRLAVVWLDVALGTLRTDDVLLQTGFGGLERVVVAGVTPPAGAVWYRLHVQGAAMLARPAATLSSVALPWAPGGGCDTATASPMPLDVITAWRDDPRVGRMAQRGLVVEEL